jgi:regulator of RNase E activity RraA
LWPNCPALSGYLRTVRLEPGAGSPLADLLDGFASWDAEIVFVDLGARLDVQCWGSVLATVARRFGVRGALVNGAARDLEGLRSLDFPTYGRGVHPAAMRGRLRLVATDEPAELDGQTVDSGAFAVADESGVVVVPRADVDDVLRAAAELKEHEETLLRAVESGADPREVFTADEPRAAP